MSPRMPAANTAVLIVALCAPIAALAKDHHTPTGSGHFSTVHSGGTYKAPSIPKATHIAPSHSTYHAPKPSRSFTSSSSAHHFRAPGTRDSHGRLVRSTKAKDVFKRSHPCPSTGGSSGACPGYVIDHVRPLKRGGADAPGNMQWQAKAAARAKDKRE